MYQANIAYGFSVGVALFGDQTYVYTSRNSPSGQSSSSSSFTTGSWPQPPRLLQVPGSDVYLLHITGSLQTTYIKIQVNPNSCSTQTIEQLPMRHLLPVHLSITQGR
eukprot:TRINITY_DN4326_c0_g2_i3.p1 TRINITY_DN4326_c0_g2~~TRINITY_DN4326_c0_g2_i3.p1  ORF type:complete len:107 (-),score=6.24 TRINITY_DN4326_c0_g2_i3:48-368(-)